MKEAVASILVQRMDGCARDQFWAVAAISGLNGFVVVQGQELLALVPRYFLILAVVFPGCYAVYYIIHRHCSYYAYRADLAKLIPDEDWVPRWMVCAPKASSKKTFLGSVFYLLLVVGATITGVLTSLRPLCNPAHG